MNRGSEVPVVPHIRVLVVDDHAVVRSGIASVLTRSSEIKVVGLVASDDEALKFLASSSPDVVILDYRLGASNGAELCAAILARRPTLPILMLSGYLEDEIIHACLAAGARGYMLKESLSAELISAVRTLARGEPVLGPQVVDRVIEWSRRAKNVQRQTTPLAPHEVSVLALASQGRSNRAIAKQLKLSETTVKTYFRSLVRKLEVGTRTEAVAVGIHRGLI